jgi:23S rRNA (cytidine1920-2'-O)/16S rRNA (cytidine1409-2'-O)-methyltransferase
LHKLKKIRADQLLVELGLAESRTKAAALILAGDVYCGEQKILKAGTNYPITAQLDVRRKDHPWVSRGGLKLDHALKHFDLDVTDKTIVDIGASTGGFTDVLLTNGAKKVYAVDVGHGQLAWKLQTDDRVIVLDKTNARYLNSEKISDNFDMITCDASFISLKKVLPATLDMAGPGTMLTALIKPQFEVGRGQLGKGGVVRDSALHEAVCNDIRTWLVEIGWKIIGITQSPIYGPKGNAEFLIIAEKLTI